MGLFSKKICVICGEKAGLLSRLKLENDDFVCGNCKKKLSPFFDYKDKVHTILKKRYATTSHGANRRGKKSSHSKGTIAFN